MIQRKLDIKKVRTLFDYIRENRVNGNTSLVMIDADTLTGIPEATLKYVCEKVGLEWDPGMLSWKKGKVEEFSKWPGFHKDAENSTGFKAANGNHKNDAELPDIVHQTIEENIPVYEYLKSFAFQSIKGNGEICGIGHLNKKGRGDRTYRCISNKEEGVVNVYS